MRLPYLSAAYHSPPQPEAPLHALCGSSICPMRLKHMPHAVQAIPNAAHAPTKHQLSPYHLLSLCCPYYRYMYLHGQS